MRRLPARRGLTLLVLALLIGSSPCTGEEVPFPKGHSTQTYDDRSFDILLPDEDECPRPWALLMVVPGSVSSFDRLAEAGYVVCAPNKKIESAGSWSAGEVKGINKLTKHLTALLAIPKTRVHAVGVGDAQGIFPMLAFGKKSPFVSAVFVETAYRGGSVGGHLKRRMGVLAFDGSYAHNEGTKRIEQSLAGKVRSVELRTDAAGIHGVYFKYWLDVMDGRFVPGYDHSFAWIDGEDLEGSSAVLQRLPGGNGSFLYFWSKKDASDPAAKELQNRVFFDKSVRHYGIHLRAVKLQRERFSKLFEKYGLERTPAVVVLGASGEATQSLQGPIKAKALVAAMKKVTGKR